MSKAKQVAKVLSKTVHATPAGASMDIPLSLIDVDTDFNVRQTADEEEIKGLSKTMDMEGQIQDVIVEPIANGRYMLIAGHRRRAAAIMLGWDSIRGSIWQATDAKGEPLTDQKEIEIARYFVNLTENVARANISTFDLAQRCKLLKRKYDLKGDSIAKRLSKNTGYVNNLLAIMGEGEKGEHAGNTLAGPILARWREECSWSDDDLRMRVCRTNTLRQWVRMDHETQLARFSRELFVAEGGDAEEYDRKLKEATQGTSAAGAGAGAGNGGADKDALVRATASQINKAYEAALRVKKTAKGEKLVRVNGIIDALDFVMGVKRGLTNRLKGVCAFDKEGVMIEGAPEVAKEAKAGASAQASAN